MTLCFLLHSLEFKSMYSRSSKSIKKRWPKGDSLHLRVLDCGDDVHDEASDFVNFCELFVLGF